MGPHSLDQPAKPPRKNTSPPLTIFNARNLDQKGLGDPHGDPSWFLCPQRLQHSRSGLQIDRPKLLLPHIWNVLKKKLAGVRGWRVGGGAPTWQKPLPV